MAGERDVCSKAVALSLHAVAKREGRSFAAILFSSPGEWVSFLFNHNSANQRTAAGEECRLGLLEGIMKVATFFFGGGTDHESPLKEACRLIEEGAPNGVKPTSSL
jgi:uncharacterized protein with von Willebrand factor type A (vWA) domain